MQHYAAVGLAIAIQWRVRRAQIGLGLSEAPRPLQVDEPHLREWVAHWRLIFVERCNWRSRCVSCTMR
jgi:hypothetical protein